MQLFIVPRDENPAIIREPSKALRQLSQIASDDNVIVISGKVRRVPTFFVDREKKAVNARFLRRYGLRWSERLGRWAQNGDNGLGRVIIEV